jgi:hypothetical protein
LDETYWWRVRSQFNLVDGLTFMNNGTLGPVPKVVQDENDRVAREIGSDPTNGYRNEELHEKRKGLARFVGAAPEEIAYTRSTTEGMNIFAHGIDWREGDEILMCNHEHDGGVEPYLMLEKRRGVKIRRVDVPSPPSSADQIVSIYENAITPKTRAIMVSHVTYVTGLVMPMKGLSEMARRKGVLTSVDGAHPLGMMDLDLHDIGCDTTPPPGRSGFSAAPERASPISVRTCRIASGPSWGRAAPWAPTGCATSTRMPGDTRTAGSGTRPRRSECSPPSSSRRPSARRTSRRGCGSSRHV